MSPRHDPSALALPTARPATARPVAMPSPRRFAAAALLGAGAAALLLAPRPAAAAQVGVTVEINQPGVYGRVDIGRYPPQGVYGQPVIVQPVVTEHVVVAPPVWRAPQPVVIYRPAPPPEPLVLWVPPGHRKHWRHHCAQYRACGVPVVFVDDDRGRHHHRHHGGPRGDGYGYDRYGDQGGYSGHGSQGGHGSHGGRGGYGSQGGYSNQGGYGAGPVVRGGPVYGVPVALPAPVRPPVVVVQAPAPVWGPAVVVPGRDRGDRGEWRGPGRGHGHGGGRDRD